MLLLYNDNSKFMHAKNSLQRLLYIDRKLSLLPKPALKSRKSRKSRKE